MATRNVLLTICVLVLCGILVAGLWPFHAPKNEVSWSKGSNGVLFGKYGTIVSVIPFEARAYQRREHSCSVEMWLAPNRTDSGGMILSFDRPHSRATPLGVRQFRGGLVIERGSQTDFAKRKGIYVGGVFKSLTPVFVTITSGEEAGVATYVDSTLVNKVPNFTFLSQELTGKLVVGNAVSTSYPWPGQFRGLAIYDRELTASEVSQHYANWTGNKQNELADSDGIVSLYSFNEERKRNS